MNIYFLVEGKRTEKKVYPKWLSHLIPTLSRVQTYDQANRNNYCLVSAEGFPAILTIHLPNAIKDVNLHGNYNYLVVCLDADDTDVKDRESEVLEAVNNKTIKKAELKVIVQNRTIETWFLGNRKVIPRQPQRPLLRKFLEFHDIISQDPEEMGIYPKYSNHSVFHLDYLKEVFKEKNLSYSKTTPQEVTEPYYLEQLIRRREETLQMETFGGFLDFCNGIKEQLS